MKYLVPLFFMMLPLVSFSQAKIFHQTTDKYDIQFSDSWTADSSGVQGTKLILLSPMENVSDEFKENISILVQDLTGMNIELPQYKEITDKQLKDMPAVSEVIQSEIVTVKNKKYYKVDYRMTQAKFNLRIISYCYIKDEKAWLVTFTAEQEKFDQFKQAGFAVLDSFTLLP